MSKGTRVAVWGLGAMGSGMARMILEKPSLELVGAVSRTRSKEGKDLAQVCCLAGSTGITVSGDAERCFRACRPDVVLHATSTFLREVAPELAAVARLGIDVITIAEEMAFPWAADRGLAEELDQLAQRHGATILGTGINPGFVLDVLVIVLTGVCRSVRAISARRVNDLSPFGATVMLAQGVGLSPAEFARGVREGRIVGHIGFTQSISLIAATTGLRIQEIRERREPIISASYRETPHVKVEPGAVAGSRQIAEGICDGKVVVLLDHPQQVLPQAEGTATGDYISIEGDPSINLRIEPEVPGGTGTVAIAVNMIPGVLGAKPGLTTMADLPIPRGLLSSTAGWDGRCRNGRPGGKE